MPKRCPRCKITKDDDSFYRLSSGYLSGYCKKCVYEHRKERAAKNPDIIKRYNQDYYQRHSVEFNEKVKEYRRRKPEIATKSRKAWEDRNPERMTQILKQRRQKHKDLVFDAYGGYECACCGETQKEFLTIDHINNDGAEHRKKLKLIRGGSAFFTWLRRNKYPAGFQVLCRNCNWGKHVNNGICPHQQSEGSSTIPKGSRAEANAARSAEPRFFCERLRVVK